MKTMKKTCTTFLLAFVMLLACLFPAFAVKDTKKASALTSCDTLYYFSDTIYSLYDEDSIDDYCDNYCLTQFYYVDLESLINSGSIQALISSSNYLDQQQSSDFSDSYENVLFYFDFIVKKPSEDILVELFEDIHANYNDSRIIIITAFDFSFEAEDEYLYENIIEGIDLAGSFIETVLDQQDGTWSATPYLIDHRLLGVWNTNFSVIDCFASPVMQRFLTKIGYTDSDFNPELCQWFLEENNIQIYVNQPMGYSTNDEPQFIHLNTGRPTSYNEIEVVTEDGLIAISYAPFSDSAFYSYLHSRQREGNSGTPIINDDIQIYVLKIGRITYSPDGLYWDESDQWDVLDKGEIQEYLRNMLDLPY